MPWTDGMEDYLQQSWREIFANAGAAMKVRKAFDALWNDVLQAGVWGEKSHVATTPP